MGNTNGGGSGSFRNERVVSANQYSRPMIGGGPVKHHGVVVGTAKGNSYLIHSGPGAGVVTTPSSNMSKNWTKGNAIKVNGTKTVQNAFNGAGGRTNSKMGQYLTGGTCIGATAGVKKALNK
mmetsp:Transcript_7099/g.6298  ORF Transcript_7099/g.6298 Transcript_7099/m.6298 type:complete len:122 (-) Transcript_7099:187-552(-)